VVKKNYEWQDGAVLSEHSKRKHKILREYFFRYLTVRCQLPQQEKFRLAIVDGFSGGGKYKCGAAGSPIIFIEELRRALDGINLHRSTQNLGLIEIECLLILNDADNDAIECLKSNCAPLEAEAKENAPKLHLQVHYLNDQFETAYPKIKELLKQGRYRNILFNLDQCGHSHVERKTIVDIMRSNPSVEIFYTFAIQSLISFLRKSEPTLLATQLKYLGLETTELSVLEGLMNNNTWLGTAERIVFETFKTCAPFVSPFSINNPDGWRYWFIHFANSFRAREVYNVVLHDNSSSQAHFGKSGLNMLSYDPSHENAELYLFDESGRESAKRQLLDDIPRLVSEHGDVVGMSEFYENIYNATAAHKDDIHAAITENPDLEVITPSGGERRKANTISSNDVMKLKKQKSFFPMFLNTKK